MIDVKFFDACQNCPYIDVYSNSDLIYGDGVIVMVNTSITCKHIDICKRVIDYERNNIISGDTKK